MRLYIGALQKIPDGVRFSFYDSRKNRMLILSDDDPAGTFKAVPAEMLKCLTAEERRWYNNACREINSAWLAEHRTEAERAANTLLDLFEEELIAEIQKKGTTDDGGNTGE